MEDVATTVVGLEEDWISKVSSSVRAKAPTSTEWLVAIGSALLLVLAFPDFDLFPLAWIALSPLLVIVARRPSSAGRALILGWTSGALFFYFSCYWLTYSMIHFGGLSPWLAYPLLVPGAFLVGVFPGLFAALTSITVRRWGSVGLFAAPVFWPAMEWCRLEVTGQLWNAIGYSQAEVASGLMIQSARWGGVYLVGALIISVNAGLAFLILNRSRRGLIGFTTLSACVAVVIFASAGSFFRDDSNAGYLNVVAVQPNVPMSLMKSDEELRQLFKRHLTMSVDALHSLPTDGLPRLVIWPESPMNFTYASDTEFRAAVKKFVTENHTSLLFNSLEPAPNDGAYNSAVLINEEGRRIAQYDKIRLMPFGEYVPLPRWLPGASLITGLVGDFAAGKEYVLMPLTGGNAGVFICIESAYPNIARQFANEGADVLINISNDGYLGPTAVMRQHLANSVFRAVENARPLLSVTNSGLTAFIRPDGRVNDQTSGFDLAVRTWQVSKAAESKTFYTRHGDLFVKVAAVSTLLIIVVTLFVGRRSSKSTRWKRI